MKKITNIKGERNKALTTMKAIIFVVVLVFQFLVIYFMYTGSLLLEIYSTILSQAIRIGAVVYILYGHEKIAYKITWISFIAILPVAGILIYMIFGRVRTSKIIKKDRDETMKLSHHLFVNDNEVIDNIGKEDKYAKRIFENLRNTTSYPVYENEGVKYFDSGEKYFEELKKDLKLAKKYIFIEYFIISKGKLFEEIFEILEEKRSENVEVKIIADAWGTMNRLPKDIYDRCEKSGIELYKYNKIKYGISNYLNYRDHRKIVVIDGLIAYTGGLNIGDEYINKHIRFGHWKDTGIKVIGKCVESFTICFLKMLQIVTKKEVNYCDYITGVRNIYKENIDKFKEKKGYIMFYSDGPDNRKNPGETTYIQALNMAKNYVYIYTPYFVVSSEVLNAIFTASRSGVEVKIITPYKPDKWFMKVINRSYYDVLLEAGVEIYEYKPGFLHAKSFVVDDQISIIGSVNLDFRSMNLNYECGVVTYKTGVETDAKKDYIETLEKSIKIEMKDIENKKFGAKVMEAIVNAFGPAL